MVLSNPKLYHVALLVLAGGCVYNAVQGIRPGQTSLNYGKTKRSNSPAVFWFIVLLWGVMGLLIGFWVLTGMYG